MNLYETLSICPVCLKTIKAAYNKKDGAVYLEKTCDEHGDFSCLISKKAIDFENWRANVTNIKPKEALLQTREGCPRDCGPCNEHMQTACCVLIDITDKCDQKCNICFASASPEKKQNLSLYEIEQKYDLLLNLSEERKFNIQLSGGEPATHKNLPEIIKMAKDKGFEYVQLNSNGKRLGLEAEYAKTLKSAGLDAVFMQFDGMDDGIYEELRGEKLLKIKKKAIENCRGAKLPVALVPTIVRGINDGNIGAMINFMLENTDVIKGIHFQPVSLFGRYPRGMGEKDRFTMFDAIDEIAGQTGGAISKSDLIPIETGHNLCCFYANYLKQEDGSILCTSAEARETGKYGPGDCGCGEVQPQCCPPPITQCCPPPIEIISKDRDYVLNKWKMAGTASEDGFDAFLNHMRDNSFTLTGMAFQDAMSFDTERVKRCRVQVLSGDNRLIPFCAYNVTDINGNYLYR